MLREAGYRQRGDDRDLVRVAPGNDAEFFYLRPRDIATYVGSGGLDLGITGRDLLLDAETDDAETDDAETGAEEMLDLGFGGAAFRFAARPGTLGPPADPAGLAGLAGRRIATADPGGVARYLAEDGLAAEVVSLDRAVEDALRLGV